MSSLASWFGALADWTVLGPLLLAATIGGLVRGFTGFGFAMVFMPIAASVVAPPLALAIIFFIDMPFALVLGARALPKADWRNVVLLIAAAACFFPVGLYLLTTLDPLATRWTISAIVLAAVVLLASGWRYRGKPGPPLTLAVGSVSGLFNGLASLSGLPIAVFWLSSQTKKPIEIRHDMQAYFGLSTLVSTAIMASRGLLTLEALKLALWLAPAYGLMMFIGTRGFHLSSEATFRRVAYLIILLAAVLGAPALDRFVR